MKKIILLFFGFFCLVSCNQDVIDVNESRTDTLYVFKTDTILIINKDTLYIENQTNDVCVLDYLSSQIWEWSNYSKFASSGAFYRNDWYYPLSDGRVNVDYSQCSLKYIDTINDSITFEYNKYIPYYPWPEYNWQTGETTIDTIWADLTIKDFYLNIIDNFCGDRITFSSKYDNCRNWSDIFMDRTVKDTILTIKCPHKDMLLKNKMYYDLINRNISCIGL